METTGSSSEGMHEPTWIVSHDILMELLERAFGGEHPMAIYAELTILAEEVLGMPYETDE